MFYRSIRKSRSITFEPPKSTFSYFWDVEKTPLHEKKCQMTFLWSGVFMERCFYGAVFLWSSVFMERCFYGAVFLWSGVFMERCFYGVVFLWSGVFLSG
jgi:hypothetical protein